MENPKKQGMIAIAQYPNNRFGLSVHTRERRSKATTSFTYEKTVPMSDIYSDSSTIEPKKQQTEWVYEGTLRPLEKGTVTFLVDNHNSPLSVEIQGKKIHLHPENSFETITLTDLQHNQPIPIKFTALTEGYVPKFRFLWRINGLITPVPDYTVTSPAISNNRTAPSKPVVAATVNILTTKNHQKKLRIGIYKNKGRIAVINSHSPILAALKNNPKNSNNGLRAYHLFSWMIDKPRLAGENKQSFILSTLPSTQFSGFDFHPNQNLFVDSFNSPHEWTKGEPRAQAQLSDLLLPSGQWHRHYDTVVISESANDKQVELIQHWLELTGGSLLIIRDKHKTMSPSVRKLITAIEPIDNIDSAEPTLTNTAFQQVISLPPSSLSAHRLSPELLENVQYFSLNIKDANNKPIVTFHDIKVNPSHSWQALAQEIETKVNHDLTSRSLPPITVRYKNNTLNLRGKGMIFAQFQLKKINDIPYFQVNKKMSTFVENEKTIHQMTFKLNGFNHWTHLSFRFVGDNRDITQYRAPFKAFDTQFSSAENFANYLENYLRHQLNDNSIRVVLKQIDNQYVDRKEQHLQIIVPKGRRFEQFNFGYQQQIFPILVAENPEAEANKLVVGAIQGKLPDNNNIQQYQILEQPKFGKVTLNPITKEWLYYANEQSAETNDDQFDLVAIMGDGSLSAPMSIQLQSNTPPNLSLPGKRIFTIPDPIYQQPKPRYHPVPQNMHIHSIQVAQTHLQSPNADSVSLTANRWVLIKLDITSPSSAKAPDFVAIISDNDGKELGRVRLIGPDTLPIALTPQPDATNIFAHKAHATSFTAPLKGEWIKPNIKIRILANNTPIISNDTDIHGVISPNITLDSHIVTYVDNSSVYRQGHGVYTYSPLSWGLEAAAKLPIKQLTLYSYPSSSRNPSLVPYIDRNIHYSVLVNPKYDDLKKIPYHIDSQIYWATLNSQQHKEKHNVNSDYYYTATEQFIPLKPHGQVLGLASPHYGGGVNNPITLWHEIFGHGLGLPHTTDKNHGNNIAYDQYRQHYITYKYKNASGDYVDMYPTMYPYHSYFTSEQYDAFLPHTGEYNKKIHRNLKTKMRWQPNEIQGEDKEDGGFAGEGFYQHWDDDTQTWVTLTQYNWSKYNYHQVDIDQLPHQRDVPVYWLRGLSLKLADGSPHPYNYINVDRTIGHLPADYHNLETGEGRPFTRYNSYGLKVTYATQGGLLTERLQIQAGQDFISLNIADKGELVKFSIHELSSQKTLGSTVYQYKNPSSLINRVFSLHHEETLPEKLYLDNYWSGSPVFWATTDKELLDFSTGVVNMDKITPQSALFASWIENGRRRQHTISLAKPFGKQHKEDTNTQFFPLNHLNMQGDPHNTPSTHINVLSSQSFLPDVHVNQQINILRLGLPEDNYHYWVVLMIYDEQGNIQEYTPLESWHISGNQKTLTVKGTIDSTPGLELAGIKIYIDKHLQDAVPASSIWLHQNKSGQLAENREFLNYDRPVIFNSIADQPEQFVSIPETQRDLALSAHQQLIPSTTLVAPLIA
ncbi:hypothetical protein [Providencia rettgeri]|uniref:hypothetical protein n=1 Tax=Providencia rettgeri TaxID=587 RepID=UPI0034E0599B